MHIKTGVLAKPVMAGRGRPCVCQSVRAMAMVYVMQVAPCFSLPCIQVCVFAGVRVSPDVDVVICVAFRGSFRLQVCDADRQQGIKTPYQPCCVTPRSIQQPGTTQRSTATCRVAKSRKLRNQTPRDTPQPNIHAVVRAMRYRT